MLSGALSGSVIDNIPSVSADDFLTVFLTCALVAYIAGKGDQIAKDLGGSIDASFGDRVIKDGLQLWQDAKSGYNKAKDIVLEIAYDIKKKKGK